MGQFYSPRIVTRGLALCLDFASTKCYSGSGSTVYNIANKNNNWNGTLILTPTFQPNVGGGSFYFHGSQSERIRVTGLDAEVDYLFADSVSRWSYSVWFKHTNNLDGVLCGLAGGIGSSTTNATYIESNNLRVRLRGIANDTLVASSVDSSKFNFICVTWDGSTCYAYFNDKEPVIVNVGNASVQSEYDFHLAACRQGLSNYAHFDGNIAQSLVYNVSLTKEEVLRNYTSIRARFI